VGLKKSLVENHCFSLLFKIYIRRLLDDNILRWGSENVPNEDEDEEDDEDDEEEEQRNGLDENLAKSIFEKLGQAQPIPPSEIPDFHARYTMIQLSLFFIDIFVYYHL
jgi:hypothetical protein